MLFDALLLLCVGLVGRYVSAKNLTNVKDLMSRMNETMTQSTGRLDMEYYNMNGNRNRSPDDTDTGTFAMEYEPTWENPQETEVVGLYNALHRAHLSSFVDPSDPRSWYNQSDIGYGRLFSLRNETKPLWCGEGFSIRIVQNLNLRTNGARERIYAGNRTVTLFRKALLRSARHLVGLIKSNLENKISATENPQVSEGYRFISRITQQCAEEVYKMWLYDILGIFYDRSDPSWTGYLAKEMCGQYSESQREFFECFNPSNSTVHWGSSSTSNSTYKFPSPPALRHGMFG